MVACRQSTGVLSRSISVFSTRLENFPEYFLYRVSLFSVSRFHMFAIHDYFVIAQQLTKQIYQQPLARSCHYCERQTIVTSFANIICRSQEKGPRGSRMYWFMDSRSVEVFSYKHSCRNNNSIYLMSASCGLIRVKFLLCFANVEL